MSDNTECSSASEATETRQILSEIKDLLKQQNILLTSLVENKARNDSNTGDSFEKRVRFPTTPVLTDRIPEQDVVYGRQEIAYYNAGSLESAYEELTIPCCGQMAPCGVTKGIGTTEYGDPQFLREIPSESPQSGQAGHSFKYWVPLYAHQDRFFTTKTHACKPWAGGRPDFIAPWELLRGEDGKYYHIDDEQQKEVIFDGSNHRVIRTPYSFMPPIPTPTRDLSGSTLISLAGITQGWNDIQQNLGDLFSVPPDGRIPLAFERNELRLRCRNKQLSQYIKKAGKLFRDLRDNEGLFLVKDFDHNLASVTYRSENKLSDDWEKQPAYWKAVLPSLLAEQHGFSVPPMDCGWNWNEETLRKVLLGMHDEDMVFKCFEKRFSRIIRPWYRLVFCANLPSLFDRSIPHKEILEKCGHLFHLDLDDPRVTKHLEGVVSTMLDMHLFCRRFRTVGNPFLTEWRPFHITWHKIFRGGSKAELNISAWEQGELYGNGDDLIQEHACTLLFLPSDACSIGANPSNFHLVISDSWKYIDDFWTILLLAPKSERLISEALHPSTSFTFVIDLIAWYLEDAANSWSEIADHFRTILYYPILNPRIHDKLLYDDHEFTRSRQYFWAVNSLEVFKTQIEDTIEEWKHFWEARETIIRRIGQASYIRGKEILQKCGYEKEDAERYMPDSLRLPVDTINEALQKVEAQLRRLRDHKAQFEALHQSALALREGLFNASAVIESRASTRLGENVKLLTYVSIFFLPLAFCVAVWSINEHYARTPLVITTVVLGAATYFTVANLNNISTMMSRVYYGVRKRVVDLMRKDVDEEWAERGKRFISFRPEREGGKISEWYIAYFLLIHAARKAKGLVTRGRSRTDSAA